VDYPKEKTVHQLFEEQVEKTPDKTVVIACDKTLTYSELNEQANRIAHGLIEKGVGIGDIVALMLPRRSFLIAAMFGVLKAGAAYMPIDPDYPQDRIEYMLNDSGVKFCVTEDNIIELLANENVTNPSLPMSSDEKCYCIYTSGSTGKPKGAVLTHKGLVNFCDNNSNNNYQYCMLGIGKNIISTIKIDFDIFTFEVCLTLLNGLKVILANEEEIGNGDKIGRLMQTQNADVLHITPTKLQLYCAFDGFCKALFGIRIIMVGAEVFTQKLYETIRSYTSAIVYNGYGPSETTIGVSFAEIKDDRSAF
jgi:non-ribosomal peptide synthetase component F